MRFSFEASSLRLAVEVASELRTGAADAVAVRPLLARARSPRRWAVTLTTEPVMLLPPELISRVRAARDVVSRHQDAGFVGWEPVDVQAG